MVIEACFMHWCYYQTLRAGRFELFIFLFLHPFISISIEYSGDDWRLTPFYADVLWGLLCAIGCGLLTRGP
jgi:hypothetical protein